MYPSSEHLYAASDPMVSVVVPAYRCARHISRTLDSVFAQTFRNFEVILVNDGCPETEALEASLRPHVSKIKYFKQTNSGAAIARNRAVDESRGDLIAFLDGDDIWEPEYLTEQVRFLTNGGFDMVYCDADLLWEDGSVGRTFMDLSPSMGEVTVQSLLDLSCHVITSGTLIRKATFADAGGFESSRVLSEDFHLWVRVAHSGARVGYQKKVLLRYRVSVDGLSGDEVSRVERAIDVYRRIERDIDLSSAEASVLRRRLRNFTVDLAIARGKSHLVDGANRKAAAEFARAASRRPTAKIAAAALLSFIAPNSLRRGMTANPYTGHENADAAAASQGKKD